MLPVDMYNCTPYERYCVRRNISYILIIKKDLLSLAYFRYIRHITTKVDCIYIFMQHLKFDNVLVGCFLNKPPSEYHHSNKIDNDAWG